MQKYKHIDYDKLYDPSPSNCNKTVDKCQKIDTLVWNALQLKKKVGFEVFDFLVWVNLPKWRTKQAELLAGNVQKKKKKKKKKAAFEPCCFPFICVNIASAAAHWW